MYTLECVHVRVCAYLLCVYVCGMHHVCLCEYLCLVCYLCGVCVFVGCMCLCVCVSCVCLFVMYVFVCVLCVCVCPHTTHMTLSLPYALILHSVDWFKVMSSSVLLPSLLWLNNIFEQASKIISP